MFNRTSIECHWLNSINGTRVHRVEISKDAYGTMRADYTAVQDCPRGATAWCVVRGAWCLVRGAWCVVLGA